MIYSDYFSSLPSLCPPYHTHSFTVTLYLSTLLIHFSFYSFLATTSTHSILVFSSSLTVLLSFFFLLFFCRFYPPPLLPTIPTLFLLLIITIIICPLFCFLVYPSFFSCSSLFRFFIFFTPFFSVPHSHISSCASFLHFSLFFSTFPPLFHFPFSPSHIPTFISFPRSYTILFFTFPLLFSTFSLLF